VPGEEHVDRWIAAPERADRLIRRLCIRNTAKTMTTDIKMEINSSNRVPGEVVGGHHAGLSRSRAETGTDTIVPQLTRKK